MAHKPNIKTCFRDGEDKVACEESLIGLIEPETHLWDVNDIDYRNKSRRQSTYLQLGKILGKTGEECISIWENLRGQYYAAKRKLSAGSSATGRSGFRHYDSMRFLSDFPKASGIMKTVFKNPEEKIAFEDKLLRLIEQETHLWNVEDTDYKNKPRRQNTFKRLGKKMGKSDDVCQTIWDNLRGQYCASKRKLKAGTGGTGFRHFETMRFLSDFSNASGTISNVLEESVDIGFESIDQTELQIIKLEDIGDEISCETSTLNIQPIPNQSVDIFCPSSSSTPASHFKLQGVCSSKRKIDRVENETAKEGETPKVEDEFDTIGKTIAHKLRKINMMDPKLSSECQFKFHEILHVAELKLL